jgi:hypothetical protein
MLLKVVVETESFSVELTPCFVLLTVFPIFSFHDFSEIRESGNPSHSWTLQTPHILLAGKFIVCGCRN